MNEPLEEIKLWLQTHRAKVCPMCLTQKVRPSLIKGTYYCPSCSKYWMVQRNKVTGVANWNYKEILERK